jgi:mannose-6-phosphate isomerase-like protein (cupin superfamily)
MGIVSETMSAFPFDEEPIARSRDEALLLAVPESAVVAARPNPPIEVIHFGVTYLPKPFSAPKWVYQNADVKIEWQDMKGRQPHYHRNLDVDEMSYQVAGSRQLLSELGSVDLGPDDAVRIPVGVAHDNWGKGEVHVLFYVSAPVHDELATVRRSEPHEFKDWPPSTVVESVTTGSVRENHLADERLLMEYAYQDERRLAVIRAADPGPRTSWRWKARSVWLGVTTVAWSRGVDYQRHMNVDEVQFQLVGRRTLVTQSGVVDIEPGDFAQVPTGCAHASICGDHSRWLTIVSKLPFEQVAEPTKVGVQRTPDDLALLRSAVASAGE